MVRSVARDTTAGPILFRRQLPPHMLLIDHLLRTTLFPLQHYVQCRGAILEALYWISEGFWFSPSELVMTALLHFEDTVHRNGLAQAESIPLLMPRLLSQVLKHLGFLEEPRIERRFRCPQVLSMDQRVTRAETTLEDCHSMLSQIMSHLGLPHVPAHRDEPSIVATASLDVLAAAATDPPPPHA